MSVKIGDAVKLHAGEGKDPISATVEAVHESGAIDAKLENGECTYVLAGNFDVVTIEAKPATPAVTPAPVAAAPKPAAAVKAPQVTHLGKHTTIKR